MNRPLRLLGITVTVGIAALSLSGLTAPAHAATGTATNCGEVARWYDSVPWQHPKDGIGRYANYLIGEAVHCLINAERAKAGLPPLKWNGKLWVAAAGHAKAAVNLKWWTPGADKHINPATRSTPAVRIKAAGYCPGGRSWSGAEIAYTGGTGKATPRAALQWWMNSPEHRAIILNSSLTEIGAAALGGSANPAQANTAKAGTYVVNFGHCR